MKAILVNFAYDPQWLKEYPELEVTMYDRSDDNIERNLTQYGAVYKTPNTGDVDHDKLTWLIENYDNLPDVFLWSKTNLPKFFEEIRFHELAISSSFTPLIRLDHKIYSDKWGQVNKYEGEFYWERNDSWYFNAGLDSSGRFRNWEDWASTFGLPRNRAFIPFAPGGSYILTRDTVRKHAKDLYVGMRDTLPYAKHPVEAHCCERSYGLLWSI